MVYVGTSSVDVRLNGRRWCPPRGSSPRSTDATLKLMLRGLCSSALVTVVLACGGGQPQQPNEQPPAAFAPPTQSSGSPPSLNPIVLENARSGDTAWQLTHRAPPGVLEGYAGALSVDHGEALDVHVRADGPHEVRWQAWRMGWYGGAQGRLVASGGPVPVAQQPAPVPMPTGLIACNWPVTFVVQTDPTWTSGIYMVKLVRDDGFDAYVPFVVRADERKGVGVYEVPFTTYQAYNSWGGLSLYDGSPPAVEVSFDRPFVQGNGSGQYFWFEHFFVTWAESRGYDLTYLTNIDVDRDPTLLTGQKLFLVVGHDEYWSRPEREAVESALGDGTSVAAFSANTGYWQVRLEPARADGRPRRTVVCWKLRADTQDPLRGSPLETTRWRSPPISEPEGSLFGVEYGDWISRSWKTVSGRPWIVAHHDAWPYDGTGAADGDTIPGIVGYETDRTDGSMPNGTVVLSNSPVTDVFGHADVQQGAIRDLPGGAFVFAAGTIEWSWGLSKQGVADRRVQRVTENVFSRASLAPAP